jgi:predicted AAA+ superfamily ATPase
MIKRNISDHLLNLSEKYPVITITGPRQSGKTTLARAVFNQKEYLNLEMPDVREFARSDPRGFLNRIPEGAIIDEIQRVPELSSYIQGIVDEVRLNGMYILTGSQQFEVTNSISQSLAGRTALLKLLPFSIDELRRYDKSLHANEILYRGFYPRIYDQNIEPTQAMADYFETYVERDLRQLIQIKNLSLFEKFIRLCAGRIGQILNLNNLANDVGVSHTTIKDWITILEASYIIFLLEPFALNVRKRLVKSPKLYFYDVGLASYLLGIEKISHVETHPLKGNLFENLVVIEVLKYRFNQGKRNNLNFYRDSHNNEVDLIYNIGRNAIPIEIKAAETVALDFFKGITAFEKFISVLPHGKIIVFGGDHQETRKDTKIIPFYKITSVLDQID